MRVSEFRVGIVRTINLGNYESLKIDVSLTVTPEENADFDQLRRDAQQCLRHLAEDTYRAQHKRAQESSDA